MSLFPMYQMPEEPRTAALPLYTDVRMDYDRGVSVWENGNPVLVSGLEAVKGWAWRAIATARYRYPIYSWSYGCELESLTGQPYQADTKRSEAERYVRDALLVNPYIREVQVENTTIQGSTLHMTVALTTVYGKERLDV